MSNNKPNDGPEVTTEDKNLKVWKGEDSHCRFFCYTVTPTYVTTDDYVCGACNGNFTCENCGCCKTCGATEDPIDT